MKHLTKYTALLLIALLCACNSEKRALKYYALHPNKLAHICADKYPPETQYIEGETVLSHDTTYVPGQTKYIECPPSATPTEEQVDCPPAKTIYVIKQRVDTFVKVNTAEVDYVRSQRDSTGEQLAKQAAKTDHAEGIAKQKDKIIVYEGIAILLLLIWTFRKFIAKLFI